MLRVKINKGLSQGPRGVWSASRNVLGSVGEDGEVRSLDYRDRKVGLFGNFLERTGHGQFVRWEADEATQLQRLVPVMTSAKYYGLATRGSGRWVWHAPLMRPRCSTRGSR